MFNDEKIKLIESMPDADAILVIWVKLLVQAGRTNANGYIFLNENIPYTDEMLATLFNRQLNTVRLALNTFKRFGMIEWDDNGLCINNWEKHQNVEGLDKIREQNRIRQANYRKNQKLLSDSNVTVTSHNAPEVELEVDIDKEKSSEVKKGAAKFTPPSVNEIEKYCQERNNNIDAEQFYNFYQAKGWYVGKNKMKDWKAAIRTWEQRDKKENPRERRVIET